MPSRKLLVVVSGVIVGVLSFAAGRAQTNSESRPQQLSEYARETMTITKMDWLLLRAEVSSIRAALKSENPGRFSPPFYVYAAERGKIVASTQVDSVWFSSAGRDAVRKEFMDKVGEYCAGTLMAGGFGFPPNDYCSVRFLVPVLINDLPTYREIATWEGDKGLVFQ